MYNALRPSKMTRKRVCQCATPPYIIFCHPKKLLFLGRVCGNTGNCLPREAYIMGCRAYHELVARQVKFGWIFRKGLGTWMVKSYKVIIWMNVQRTKPRDQKTLSYLDASSNKRPHVKVKIFNNSFKQPILGRGIYYVPSFLTQISATLSNKIINALGVYSKHYSM